MATAQATVKSNSNGAVQDSPTTKEGVLELLQKGKISIQDAMRMLPKDTATGNALKCKVSQKGALSIYGLQRFPVTFYAGQWERLLQFAPSIKQFIADHNGELIRKS